MKSETTIQDFKNLLEIIGMDIMEVANMFGLSESEIHSELSYGISFRNTPLWVIAFVEGYKKGFIGKVREKDECTVPECDKNKYCSCFYFISHINPEGKSICQRCEKEKFKFSSN